MGALLRGFAARCLRFARCQLSGAAARVVIIEVR
jgi:hypothetical protein